MAVYQFSQVKGTTLSSFRARNDILNFDIGSAADLDITVSGNTLTLRLGLDFVTLERDSLGEFHTGNLRFVDGSLLLIGDNTRNTGPDANANVINGGAGNDRLIGLGGNDTLDGRQGSDTYVVMGANDGTDLYRDSGTTGTDRIVAGANGAVIRLGANFSNSLTGIEAISANGYSAVNVVGSAAADTLNFAGVALTGIALIDAQAGADNVVGSDADDTISGGAGADAIDGGAGRDTALFAGTRDSYAISTVDGVVQVQDLDTVANGNDGTDTLHNVELLQFLDATVDLTAPPPPPPPPPPANTAPNVVADSASATANDASVWVDVLANDTDVDSGDTRRVVAVNDTGLKGTALVAADGSGVTYTAGAAFQSLGAGATTTETFDYTVEDAAGEQSTAAVTVTVTGVNDGPVAVDDTFYATEDQFHLIDVLGNDTDPDSGDAVRLVAINRDSTTLGDTAFASSGGRQFVYYATPAQSPELQSLKAGATAFDHFSYTIADASGAQSSADVTVEITGVNDAPVAHSDGASVGENDGPLTINVLANDTDIDIGDTRHVVSTDGNGRPSEIVITSHPSQEVTTFVVIPAIAAIKGTVEVGQDGQGVVYTPTPALQALREGEVLNETVFYTIEDESGAQSTATAIVTVTGVNDGPQAVGDSLSVAKNSLPVTINVLANDTDADAGDSKAVDSVNTKGTLGSVTFVKGGSNVVYTVGNAFDSLPEGDTATDSFSYTMIDGFGATSIAQVKVTITGTNSGPVAFADVGEATENGAAVFINVLANDTDINVVDGKTVVEVSNTGTNGVASIAADGSGVVYTIGSAYQSLLAGEKATDIFRYTVADNAGARSSADVKVTVTGVNDPLIAIADAPTPGEDGGAVTLNVLANDKDADFGDTHSILSLTTTGLRGSAEIVGSNIVYTPNHQYLRDGQSAIETFSYRAEDGSGSQSSATVSVTVIGANDAPIAVANTLTITEDAAAITIQVLANDTDADTGDTKRVVSVTPFTPEGGTAPLGTMVSIGTGVVYTPSSTFQSLLTGQYVVETFTYTMTDAIGDEEATSTVTITVNGVTDGPKAIADKAVAAEDGGAITLNVLGNDTNDMNPGGPLTIASIDGAGRFSAYYVIGSATGNDQYGFAPGTPRLLGKASITTDGQGILYTPLQSLNQGEPGTDTFQYTLAGGSTGMVTVSVTGVNDAPEAFDDSATVAADGAPLTIDVLANDTDPDTRIDPPLPPPTSPFFDLLDVAFDPTPVDIPDTKKVVSVDRIEIQDPVTGRLMQGSVELVEGQVIYTVGGNLLNLPFGVEVNETFKYTMEDSAHATSTAYGRVTVTGINHAPVATADIAEATENGAPVTIRVLLNDSDADSGVGDSLAVSIDSAGLQGTAWVDGANIVYNVGNAFQSLGAGVTATEQLSYTIADSQGAESTSYVEVTVTGINDAPVAAANTWSISEDAGQVTLDVLANDSDADSGDTLTVVPFNPPAGLQGSVGIAAGGSALTYTVGSGFQSLLSGQTATESFTYTVKDSAGAQSTASVTLTIIGANEPVVIVNPPAPGPGAIVGGTGDDVMAGTAGADTLFGQAGDDEISAGGGADTVFGGTQDDTLSGGAGNDILSGGAGRDDLTGDAGADTFRFYVTSESNTIDFDRIRDFSLAEGDKIDLSLIDANTVLGGNNAFTLSSSFTGAAGQLVFDPVTGMLVGDVNGDALADLMIEVRGDAPGVAGILL